MMHNIEHEIKDLFQKNLTFTLNRKILKEGKLILFSFKEFYLHFKLMVKPNVYKYVEVPYPFSYSKEPGKIIFDYSNSKFTRNKTEADFIIKLIKKHKHSKFYDNILMIHYS